MDTDRLVSHAPAVDNDAVLERLAAGRLVEGPEYASDDYVKGLARTLIVSGDTELISAPAYLKAAAHAPRLQSFVSVVGIIQDGDNPRAVGSVGVLVDEPHSARLEAPDGSNMVLDLDTQGCTPELYFIVGNNGGAVDDINAVLG